MVFSGSREEKKKGGGGGGEEQGGGVMMVAVCGEVSEGQNATGSLGPPLSIPPPPPLLLLLITHTKRQEKKKKTPPHPGRFSKALISLLIILPSSHPRCSCATIIPG